MARQKASDEAFCRACGEAIKTRAARCPHCGSPTASFPGFDPDDGTTTQRQRQAARSTESHTNKDIDQRNTDDLLDDETLDEAAPYIAWSGGVFVILIGLSTLFSPGNIATGVIGGLIIIAAGAFAIPPVRAEIEPILADNDVDTPLSRGAVAAITIIGLFFGGMIAAV